MSGSLNELKDWELVDKACGLKKKKEEIDVRLKAYEAEIQKRGLRILEDKGIKQKEFYGNGGNTAEITLSQKLEVSNYSALEKVCGEIFNERVKKIQELQYDMDSKFAEILKAIFTGDYTREFTVEEVLKKCFELDGKQIALLLKKLKGSYKKDKGAIAAVLGRDGESLDADVELDYIRKAINWNKIEAFFPENTEEVIGKIKKYIYVSDTPKISVKYRE